MTQSPVGRYIEHLEAGELAYQVCADDGSVVFFPRVLAPKTGNTRLDWRVSKGIGTVYSTTVMYYRGESPLNLTLIDSDEGFRVMSRVEDIPPEKVWIGMRVTLRVHKSGDGSLPYPVFIPLAESGQEPSA
jgi:uncharacterized OB-fold protein